MNKAQSIHQYFSLLDVENVEEAAAMFESSDKINTPSEDGLVPSAFIPAHVGSALHRYHKIMDVLIGENGDSAAAHFQYFSKTEDGDNPTYEGVDHFTFGTDGKFSSLSIFYDTRPSRR